MAGWFKSGTSNKPQTLGQLGEQFAQLEYKNRGYKIIAANFFNKKGLQKGEVDFIAQSSRDIAFVEVKTRTQDSGRFGFAAESVNFPKQKRLLQAVKIFLGKYPSLNALRPHIDVCAVRVNSLKFLKVVQERPLKFLLEGRLDNLDFSAIIMENAVEDGS